MLCRRITPEEIDQTFFQCFAFESSLFLSQFPMQNVKTAAVDDKAHIRHICRTNNWKELFEMETIIKIVELETSYQVLNYNININDYFRHFFAKKKQNYF